jgi:hypothetical protein
MLTRSGADSNGGFGSGESDGIAFTLTPPAVRLHPRFRSPKGGRQYLLPHRSFDFSVERNDSHYRRNLKWLKTPLESNSIKSDSSNLAGESGRP